MTSEYPEAAEKFGTIVQIVLTFILLTGFFAFLHLMGKPMLACMDPTEPGYGLLKLVVNISGFFYDIANFFLGLEGAMETRLEQPC